MRYNYVSDYNDAGIKLEHNGYSQAYGNVIYMPGSTQHGNGLEVWDYSHVAPGNYNNLIYNNTIYGPSSNSLIIQGGNGGAAGSCMNNVVENNISVATGYGAFNAVAGCENDGTNGSGNVYLYNAFGTAASNFIQWGAGNYLSTYAALDSDYGSSTYSIQTLPTFANGATGKFALVVGSSVVNAGANLGSTYQFALDPASSWPANVVLDNQNNYGTAWEVGAYVYRPPISQFGGNSKAGGTVEQ
jgi:hypothetical protein